MNYGPSLFANFRRAATYVDKILKSASPAHLPIEQATKVDLVTNLKTAKTLGLTIPRSPTAVNAAVGRVMLVNPSTSLNGPRPARS